MQRWWSQDPEERAFFRKHAIAVAKQFLAGDLIVDDLLPSPNRWSEIRHGW